MDAVVAIINASSDKLGFVGGIIFLLIAIFCREPVVLGNVRLPPIDTVDACCWAHRHGVSERGWFTGK